MEMIHCPDHSDSLCLMKTGTKPGPSQGVSFYMCKDCKFVKQSRRPPSKCSVHNNRTIELQSLVVRKDQKGIRQYFRCDCRDEGKSWCGYKQISEHGKVDSLSTSSSGMTEQLQKKYDDEKKMKVKDSKDREGHTKDGGMNDVDATCKGKENAGTNYNQNAHVKATSTSHLNKVTDLNKKDASAQLLTFSDLSKDMPSSSTQGNKTPFQNKSFHQYRDSPDPSKQPVKHIQRQRRESSSSDSGTDHDVQETKNLMKGLTVNDKKDDVKKILFDADQRKIAAHREENKMSMLSTTETETKTQPTLSNVDSVKKDHDVETKAKLTLQTSQGSAEGKPQMDIDARVRFRNLKEDRSNTEAELNKFQITLRAIKLNALPDKGEKIMARLASYKQHIASLDKQMIALLQQYGNDISKEADASQPKPHQNPPTQPQQVYVYPGTGNAVKTVIVKANQASGPENSGKSGGTQFIQLPSHLSEYFAANPQAMTLYGGRMTAQRLREVGSITTEAIDKIHKQLETCPSESTQVSDPPGLRVALMSHQRQALAWLEWREQQHPAGGILADDMGLGKTLTMISHIMRKKQEVDGDSASVKEGWLGKDKQAKKSFKKSRASLIVAPASLVHQWAKEIEKRCSPSCLKFLVYHGPNRENNINRLCDNDVVITTYAIVSKEVGADGGNSEMAVKDEEEDEEKGDGEDENSEGQTKKSSLPLLLRICWERIILDEAHDIKNHKSARAQSVCRLRSAFRWALTGTPIQNDLKDMYSLLRFLRFSPFDELKVWKRHIESAKVSTKRLNTLIKALLLRRTKDQTTLSGKPLVELPNKTYESIEVELSEEEQKIYDKLFQKTQSTVQAYVHRHQDSGHTTNISQPRSVGNPSVHNVGGAPASGIGVNGAQAAMGNPNKPKNTGSQILVFLLRLRQCCSHLSLLKAHLESESMETDGIDLSLHEQMKGMMLDEGEEEVAPSVSSLPKTDLFEVSTLSTKLSHVMKKIQTLQEEKPTDKSVIVSQWTAMLEIVAQHLKKSKISYSLIQGNVPPKKRAEIVEDFNRTGAGAKVLLVSLCAGGVGLNLIGGNHLFLLDSHWNPALEAQACDRIYRIGQKKDVKIYRFICKKTIEEKIWMLQQGKLSLAKSVLSGTANKNQKLSLDDLRMLFGV